MKIELTPAVLTAAGIHDGEDLLIEARPDGVVVRADALRKVYVEVTGRCNLRCTMCPREQWEADAGDMTGACFAALLNGLPETPPDGVTLTFGGFGEPTIHPALLDYVASAREAGRRVELITNGTTMTTSLAERLVELGVAQVTVSVDGGNDEDYAFMRGRPVAPTWEAVAILCESRGRIRARLAVGVACVATRRNAPALPAVIDTATRMGLDFVQISNVVPHTDAMADDAVGLLAAQLSGVHPTVIRPRIILGRMDFSAATRPLVERLLSYQPVFPPPAMDTGAWQDRCRFAHEGWCAVSWDGRVAPCLSLLYTHPEVIGGRPKTVRAFHVGDVESAPLVSIWRSPEYRTLRRRLTEFDVSPCLTCGGCSISETNEADCYGTPFPACSECLWAQGVVLCP
jgi:MoaA/NifB/PqqE/SkfB family radical SAM enzyme